MSKPIPNRELSRIVNDARIRLRDKLLRFDLQQVSISEYNERYLGDKLKMPDLVLQVYTQLLELALRDAKTGLEDFVLLDYGGGSGVLSYLAKEIGIGTVVYNDIYDVSCEDVAEISAALDLKPDHIACGDIDDVIDYVRKHSIQIDAVASYDCLEHIYDVEDYFQHLYGLSDSPFRIVYGSGANIKNPRYVHAVTKQHLACESEQREKKWGHKERDSLESYFDLRKKMILSHAPDLDENKASELARATRGQMQADILKSVDEYLASGTLSYQPDHPTNTCDPETGNWCEHLMQPSYLKHVVTAGGFTCDIRPGKYSIAGGLAKRCAKRAFNSMIGLLGRNALAIAPFYVVKGERLPHNQQLSTD